MMSRSYKKFPQFRDNLWGGGSLKQGKKYNNRKIRRKLNRNLDIIVHKGRDYKKYGYDSWDLWEYKSYETKQDAIDSWKKEDIEIANGVNYWAYKYHKDLTEDIKNWFLSYSRK